MRPGSLIGPVLAVLLLTLVPAMCALPFVIGYLREPPTWTVVEA